MNRGKVETAWLTYRYLVMPADALPVQLQECRRAFYAGAQMLLTELLAMVSPGDECTEEDLQKMDQVQTELEQFSRDVSEGPRMKRKAHRVDHGWLLVEDERDGQYFVSGHDVFDPEGDASSRISGRRIETAVMGVMLGFAVVVITAAVIVAFLNGDLP